MVEYASSMKFDCLDSQEEFINAKLPKFATSNKAVQSMEIEENPDQSGGEDVTKFKVIRRMVFNSDRKRMSVLLTDPNDGKIKLYVKGADSIIMARIDKNNLSEKQLSDTNDFLNTASKQGLRTLLMAMRIVDSKEAEEFIKKCEEAERDIKNSEARLDDIYDKFEQNFTLLGATAVEDRL